MEVKSAVTEVAIPYHPPSQLLRPTAKPGNQALLADDIVDCVEICIGERVPLKGRTAKYGPLDRPPDRTRGVFVDLWI